MRTHKAYQKLYNRVVRHHDDISNMSYTENYETEEIVRYVVRYLTSEVSELQFPGKSYAVAIIYAYLLERSFQVPFQNSLCDPDLFDGTDKYFKTYEEDPETYGQILSQIRGQIPFCFQFLQAAQTKKYFLKEFGLDACNFLGGLDEGSVPGPERS